MVRGDAPRSRMPSEACSQAALLSASNAFGISVRALTTPPWLLIMTIRAASFGPRGAHHREHAVRSAQAREPSPTAPASNALACARCSGRPAALGLSCWPRLWPRAAGHATCDHCPAARRRLDQPRVSAQALQQKGSSGRDVETSGRRRHHRLARFIGGERAWDPDGLGLIMLAGSCQPVSSDDARSHAIPGLTGEYKVMSFNRLPYRSLQDVIAARAGSESTRGGGSDGGSDQILAAWWQTRWRAARQ